MTSHTKIFTITAFCFLSLSTLQLYGSESGALNIKILLLKAARSGARTMLLSPLSDQEKVEIKKTEEELTAQIAQLTEVHTAMEQVEQITQRMQQLMTARESNPSFKHSPEESSKLIADMKAAAHRLTLTLPAEERSKAPTF